MFESCFFLTRVLPRKLGSGLKSGRAAGGSSALKGTDWGGVCSGCAELGGLGKLTAITEYHIYSFAEKCNKLTGTDHKSLMLSLFCGLG
jgi:hypothetical protein